MGLERIWPVGRWDNDRRQCANADRIGQHLAVGCRRLRAHGGREDRRGAWGYDYEGQVGDGWATTGLAPVPVHIGVGYNWRWIATGSYHTVAVADPASPVVTVLEDAGAQTVVNFASLLSPGPADESAQLL